MTRLYLIGGILAVIAALCGVIWWGWKANDRLRAESAALTLQLSGCMARATNMSEDKESDDAIDNIPDDGLRNVPAGWMLDPGSGGIE